MTGIFGTYKFLGTNGGRRGFVYPSTNRPFTVLFSYRPVYFQKSQNQGTKKGYIIMVLNTALILWIGHKVQVFGKIFGRRRKKLHV